MFIDIAIGVLIGAGFFWWILKRQEHSNIAKGTPDLVNWDYLEQPLSDGIIRLKDGSLMASFRYKGKDLNGASEAQRSQLTSQINKFFQGYSNGYSFYFSMIRRPVKGYPDSGHFPDPVTYHIDEERRERHNSEGQHYISHKYLSIIWNTDGRASVDKFKSKLEDMKDELGPILRPTQLDADEHLSLLYNNMNGVKQSINAPQNSNPIDSLIANQEVQVIPIYDEKNHKVKRTLKIPVEYNLKIGDKYVRTLTIQGFPKETYNGIINDLNNLQMSYRWTTRIFTVDREVQEKKLRKARNSWRIRRKGIWSMLTSANGGEQDEDVEEAYKDQSSISKMKNTNLALSKIAERETAFSVVTSTITLFEKDLKTLNEQTFSLLSAIRDTGFTASVESFNSLDAWIGSLPGQSENIRRTMLSTKNIGDILPTWSMWNGPKENPSRFMSKTSAHWQGKTIGKEPFRKYRPASGDVGHSMIIGSTGGGKSTYANFEIAQWLRHRNSQIFLFDKGYSGQLLCQAAGGDHYDLFSDATTSFQPLRGLTPEALKSTGYYSDWINDLFTLQNENLTAGDKNKIRKALQKVAAEPREARTLSQFSFHLQDRHLKDTIRIYTRDGDYGSILDSSTTQLKDNRYQVFELNRLLDNSEKIVLPVLMHLFHKVETALDRTKPTLIIIEEAWSAFSNKHFQARLKNWLATLRKKNGHVCLIAHSPEQITSLPQPSMFIGNTPERVFLPNPDISQPHVRDHYSIFGLNDVQINIIKNLTPKRQYYIQTPAGSGAIDLELLPSSLAFLGNSSDLSLSIRQQKIQDLQDEYGDRWPVEWLNFLAMPEQAAALDKSFTTYNNKIEIIQ